MEITINITRAISIPDEVIGQRDLKAGSHIIDDSLLSHWYLKSLKESGILTIVTKKTPKSQENFKSLEQIQEIEKAKKQVQTVVITGPKVPESMQEPELVINRVEEKKVEPAIEKSIAKSAVNVPVIEPVIEKPVVEEKNPLIRRKRK